MDGYYTGILAFRQCFMFGRVPALLQVCYLKTLFTSSYGVYIPAEVVHPDGVEPSTF
jgi:hypothetical protein